MSSNDRYTSVSLTARTILHMDQMIEDLNRQIDENEQEIKMHKQQVAASIHQHTS